MVGQADSEGRPSGPRVPRGLALFALVAAVPLAALALCGPSGPPPVEKTGTLAPSAALAAAQSAAALDPSATAARRTAAAPFGVVFGAPSGETKQAVEVSLLFNRPMRPLETAGEESAPPAQITMAKGQSPAGTWRWLGTSALMFAPKDRLPAATEYEVTVPAGTRSLAGDALASD